MEDRWSRPNSLRTTSRTECDDGTNNRSRASLCPLTKLLLSSATPGTPTPPVWLFTPKCLYVSRFFLECLNPLACNIYVVTALPKNSLIALTLFIFHVFCPLPINSHCFLVSESNAFNQSSSTISSALCAAWKTFGPKSRSTLIVDMPELRDNAT